MNKLLILFFLITSCASANKKPSEVPSPLLHFYTNDNYLALFILVNKTSNRISNKKFSAEIVGFQNKIWLQNESEYRRLLEKVKNPGKLTYLGFSGQGLELNYQSLILLSKNTSEFQVLKAQTDSYRDSIERSWNENFLKTRKTVLEITGLALDKSNDVIITHPGIKNGREIGGQWIEWGGYDDQAYVITYLWHELLHNYFDRSNLSHSVIELITDNELYKRLANSDYPPIKGHRQLKVIKDCLLDDWRNYLLINHPKVMDFLHSTKTQECGLLFEDLNW